MADNIMNNCGFYVLDGETVFLEKFNIGIVGNVPEMIEVNLIRKE